MHHRSFSEAIRAVMLSAAQRAPLQILDLGCGDTTAITGALTGVPVHTYTGYDLSEQVLEVARLNLEPAFPAYTLKAGDMLSLAETESQRFGLIHSAFAIHHLSDADKQLLLEKCYQLLRPGGATDRGGCVPGQR